MTETIRFWESATYFVVMGRSGRPDEEVNLDACAADGLEVVRRSSGGGTVLQGPGCLNYELELSLEYRPELTDVRQSYDVILGMIAPALGVCHEGSDLLLDGKKVSGSAQRRTRGRLLHHGTLLYGLDLGLVERYLREPRRQPAHRRGRTHREFLANLTRSREELAHSVRSAILQNENRSENSITLDPGSFVELMSL